MPLRADGPKQPAKPARRLTGREVIQAEVATIFGVTPVTVRTWERRGCPVRRKGGPGRATLYDTAEVARWREEQATLSALGDPDDQDEKSIRRRRDQIGLIREELDLADALKDVVFVEDVGRLVGEEYSTVRAKLIALAGEIAPALDQVPAETAQQIVAEKIAGILETLAADRDFGAPGEALEGEAGEPQTAA